MTANTNAYKLVNSYPPTGANYDSAIDSLKTRFGRDDLLIQVYVRELLQLVMKNAIKTAPNVPLSELYYDLQSHLRSLKTLGVTTEKCSAMLLPLVESSLPAEVLRAWQRSDLGKEAIENIMQEAGTRTDSTDRLERLIQFIGSEVQGEERISLAAEGFDLAVVNDPAKPKKNRYNANQKDVPSAVGLLAAKGKYTNCVFCEINDHATVDCAKAKRMSLQERQEFARKKRLCFNCLKHGHGSRECRVNVRCDNCKRRHLSLMCREEKKQTVSASSDKDDTIQKGNKTDCTLASFSSDPEVCMQIVKIKLRNGNKEKVVRALFDSGSQRSYITQEAASQLGYEPVDQQSMRHLLFGGEQTSVVMHKKYLIHLASIDDSYTCNFLVLDQDKICGNIPAVKGGSWRKELQDLNIALSDYCNTEEAVSVLIGADVAGKLSTGRRIQMKCGLTALETLLGWTVIGPTTCNKQADKVCTAISMYVSNCKIKDLWSLDVLGIKDPIARKTHEQQQEEISENFLKTVKLNEEDRYEVQLPWIENHPPLGDNKTIAVKRFQSLVRKLQTDGYYSAYNDVFMEWLKDGVIERVPPGEEENFGHYLPHRHVIKENSTTVIRPVFDASAKDSTHPALNECLEKRLNLIECIPSILLRFREGKIGIISDIRKAFLQISIHVKERDFLRFLWLDESDNIIYFRHCRVVFGVCCSPFILGAVLNLHLKNILQKLNKQSSDTFCKERILKLLASFYVDNCVTSVNSENEVHRFILESKKAMEIAGFDLRGWEHSFDESSKQQAAVLGMVWDKQRDALYLNMSNFNRNDFLKVTKRVMLSAAHKIFDPLGIVCPVMLTPRILLQETWAKQGTWDEEVDINIKQRFDKWVEELEFLSEIRIRRHLFTNFTAESKISLHTFCDASQIAYAAVAFLRVENESGVYINFIQAKTRVAPIRGKGEPKHSIPRLELLAALVGVRLTRSILEAFSIKNVEVYYWSDSTTALAWINRENNWGTFVYNRVKEIREYSCPKQWQHVPGDRNPADLPSRGCTVKQLIASQWWEGPSWLCDDKNWPAEKPLCNETEVVKELKKTTIKENVSLFSFLSAAVTKKGSCSLLAANTSKKGPEEKIEVQLWDFERFSNYTKVLRVFAWVKRFIHNARSNLIHRRKGFINSNEIREAELSIIKILQTECFLGIEDEKIKHLSPFYDDNKVIRLNSRIIHREDTFNFKCPIILPAKHQIVAFIIEEKHIQLKHAGIQITMNALREKFWVLGGRRAIRSIIKKCISCQRYNAQPLASLPAPLPVDRIREAAIFEVVGVDFAGPVLLKGGQKSWICIFTCAVYRAVHLELTNSLSVAAFLMTLRRFIARRGRPSVIFSDNGKNLVGLNNTLTRVDYEKIAETVALQQIEWKFNPPSAAWWGGFWERLIGILKRLLRRTLKRSCLDYEEMVTVLLDCEAVINSRPITYMPDNDNELMPLSPLHFLSEIKEIGVVDLDAVENTDLGKRFKYRQSIKKALRRRFRSEYLGALCYQKKGININNKINIGDLVLVGSDNTKRIDWPLARVKELYEGKDGNIRVARLITAKGELTRSIQRLFPLELNCKFSKEDLDSVRVTSNIYKENATKTNKCKIAEPSLNDKNEKQTVITKRGREIKMPNRLMYH